MPRRSQRLVQRGGLLGCGECTRVVDGLEPRDGEGVQYATVGG